MRVPSRSPALEIRPNTSRGVSQTSTTSSHSRAPMSIPGARIDEPPPPLPPPRYNEELDRGIDVSWSWQNNHEAHSGKRQLAPIKPGSSMFGGYMHPRGDTRRSSDADEMDLDDWDRRGSTVSTIRSPSQADMGAGTTIPSLVRRPPSPASSNQRSVSLWFCILPEDSGVAQASSMAFASYNLHASTPMPLLTTKSPKSLFCDAIGCHYI